MAADSTMVKTQRKHVAGGFTATDAIAPQRALDPSTHRIRQRQLFEELIKNKVTIPVNNYCKCPGEARRTTHHQHKLEWLTVLALLVYVGVFMFILLQWQW